VDVRLSRILLIGALMLSVASGAWAGAVKMLVPSFAPLPQVKAMRMLTSNVGWARMQGRYRDERLLLTDDGGSHWKDITPNLFANSERGKPLPRSDTEPESIADVDFPTRIRDGCYFVAGRTMRTRRATIWQ
jgi:hypothetical protein